MIQTLRNAAVDCQDEMIRFNLNIIAAELEDALSALAKSPTVDNLTAVIGHHAHGKRMMDHAKRDNAERAARK